MNGTRILVADDEEDVLTLVGNNLARAGYDVLRAVNGAQALSLARRERPPLAVLDITMPELTGLEVCRILKNDPETERISIVLLTARAGEIDRVLAFELGADDYVNKPFSPRELTLRIQAILRRKTGETIRDPIHRAGDVIVNVDQHHIAVRGKPISLTAVEFKLLLALMESQGRVQTRQGLIKKVWGGDEAIGARTVDTHLRRLRSKLGPAGKQVHTVRGFGYRFDDHG